MKKAIIIIIAIFISLSSFSQKEDSIKFLPKYAIGVSPSAFLNIYRGLQISQDFRVLKRFNLTLESGYIFNSAIYVTRESKGLRLRFGVEYLFHANEDDGFSFGMFYLKRYIREDFHFDIRYWEQRYIRRIPVTRFKDLTGTGLNFGYKQRIIEKVYLDLGFGFGLGKLSVSDDFDFEDNDNLEYRGWAIYDITGKSFFPIIFFNFNFSYVIFD